jgi:DNA-binding transcriptional LysR family regulator
MELKQLLYFVTVVEEGTISAAAKKLFISQPPLSAQMKLLEDELGCVLFQRGQRQIQLTEAGKKLYTRASVLLEMSRVTQEEVRECAVTEAGTMRIGIISSVVCPLATEWIAEFSKLHPQINYAIYEANTYDLIEKLRANIVHMAIIRTPYMAEDMTAEALATESIVAIGRASLFPDDAPTITLAALSTLPIILYRRWEAVIKDEFEKARMPVHCKYLCDDARTAIDLVEHAVGISLVPASAARLITDPSVISKPIEGCAIESRIDLIYRANATLPSYVNDFKTYVHGRLMPPA